MPSITPPPFVEYTTYDVLTGEITGVGKIDAESLDLILDAGHPVIPGAFNTETQIIDPKTKKPKPKPADFDPSVTPSPGRSAAPKSGKPTRPPNAPPPPRIPTQAEIAKAAARAPKAITPPGNPRPAWPPRPVPIPEFVEDPPPPPPEIIPNRKPDVVLPPKPPRA
jgi:hypothetical protein